MSRDLEKDKFELLYDTKLNITVQLGETKRKIKEILEISEGTVIELDKNANEYVEIFVNGKKFALGEVVVVDENFGVRIIEIFRDKK